MKHIYSKSLFTALFFFFLFIGCTDTKLGDVDLDFNLDLTETETRSYIGKPTKVGLDIELRDPENNYPHKIIFKFSSGDLKIDNNSIESDKAMVVEPKSTLWFTYTPSELDVTDVTITVINEIVERNITYSVNCDKTFFDVNLKDVPDKILIDTKADFKLLLSEMETTGSETVQTYAKILKGKGKVYSGEEQISLEENSETEEESEPIKNSVKRVALNIGENNMSYVSAEEGENIIRLYMMNQWGYEITKDIKLPVNLPEWNLSTSMGKEPVEIPYNDKYSFNLDVGEKDIFKENSYTGVYRILSNSDLKLSINDKEYNQGAEFKLKAGGNVGILRVNDATKGAIEFIVKDKYKQERKDTIQFVSKLPIKPIEASLDNTSQSVKINQAAIFKLNLKEINYNGLFNVKYEVASGEGIFEGETEHLFSEGEHTIKFTPTKQGANTFKITITDTNEQEKILNATVQASLSSLTANISETNIELLQGAIKTITLTVDEEDYKGKYYFSYTSASNQLLNIDGTDVGIGGVVEFTKKQVLITLPSDKLGSSTFVLKVKDEYNQSKELTLKTTTKGEVKIKTTTGGTVTGGGVYSLNQTATVKATPNESSKFLGWFERGILVSPNLTYTFTVTKSIELEAKFETKGYAITVNSEAGGTVTGNGNYLYGETAKVVAVVDKNYQFLGWFEKGALVSPNLTYTFTVNKDRSLVAKFKGNPFNVTVNTQIGGTVTGGGSFEYGSKVKVTATVEPNYKFIGWHDGSKIVSNSLVYEFTVTATTVLEARFEANKYNVTVNALAGGTVTGSGSFDYGTNVKVTATVKDGYKFIGWHDGSKIVSTFLEYTFVLKGNTTLEARFEANKYNIIVNAGTGGTAKGGGTYEYGTNATLTATTIPGYKFIGWYNGSSKLATTEVYTFKVEKDLNIEARFEANKYNVIVNADTGGNVTGSGQFAYGSNTTIKATPSSNYSFVGWYEGEKLISTNATYTFNVEKDITLLAKFAIKKFKVTLTGVNGTTKGSGDYDYGSNATIEATPNSNFKFIGWYNGSSKVSENNPYTFKVEKDIILDAKFEAIEYKISVNASSGGTATGNGTYRHGENVSVVAIPSNGYKFIGWYEGSSLVSSNMNYTFRAEKDRALQAKFEEGTYSFVSISAPSPRGEWYKHEANFTYELSSNAFEQFSIKISGSQNASYKVNGTPVTNNPIIVNKGTIQVSLTPENKQGGSCEFTITVTPIDVNKPTQITELFSSKGVKFTITPSSVSSTLSKTNATERGYYVYNNESKYFTVSSEYPDVIIAHHNASHYIFSRGCNYLLNGTEMFISDFLDLSIVPDSKWLPVKNGSNVLQRKEHNSGYTFEKGVSRAPETETIRFKNSAGHIISVEWIYNFQRK